MVFDGRCFAVCFLPDSSCFDSLVKDIVVTHLHYYKVSSSFYLVAFEKKNTHVKKVKKKIVIILSVGCLTRF